MKITIDSDEIMDLVIQLLDLSKQDLHEPIEVEIPTYDSPVPEFSDLTEFDVFEDQIQET